MGKCPAERNKLPVKMLRPIDNPTKYSGTMAFRECVDCKTNKWRVHTCRVCDLPSCEDGRKAFARDPRKNNQHCVKVTFGNKAKAWVCGKCYEEYPWERLLS